MRYTEFRDAIRKELTRTSEGRTWVELRDHLDLPYERNCPEWTKRLEQEIGLIRVKGDTRALVWKLKKRGKKSSRS